LLHCASKNIVNRIGFAINARELMIGYILFKDIFYSYTL
jgi:hypothetical protein